jgi:integrase
VAEDPGEFWRLRADVSEALDVFRSGYIQDIWGKALSRKESDPDGAVTSARTLLESVCKFILEEAGETYRPNLSMRELYKQTRTVLALAPDKDTAPVFERMFDACMDIVSSIGMLRNYLSDAHGRSRFGSMPDWRHAELAVNLSGAMATYLAAVWKGHEETVRDVLLRSASAREDEIGVTQIYILKRIAESEIGKVVASKLNESDVLSYCQSRFDSGIKPQTIMQDLGGLRVAMGPAKADVFGRATVAARASGLVGKASFRTRRVTDDEIAALTAYFEEQDKQLRTKTRMGVLLHFAVSSGRQIGEICKLTWGDVDFDEKRCKIPGKKGSFPLLGKAWEIVLERSSKKPRDDESRIFPFHSKTASARSTLATKELAKTMPAIVDFQFSDLRSEAVKRLLEKGHPPHLVSEASGMDVKKVTSIYKELRAE